MTQQFENIGFPTGYGQASVQGQRQQVLRNTYWLLALSLVPTVLGAWIGVATQITAALSGWPGMIVFLGGAFGFMYAIEKTKMASTNNKFRPSATQLITPKTR